MTAGPDGWRALPGVCFIDGCTAGDVDRRGPVFLRDGSAHRACVGHWEAVMRVLGEQPATGDDRPVTGDGQAVSPVDIRSVAYASGGGFLSQPIDFQPTDDEETQQ